MATDGTSKGSRPTVTALICTLNEAETLPDMLPAIPDWTHEVLVVDGHSTDQTREVVRELRPNARFVLQPGTGKGDALKYGIQQASGDIIPSVTSLKSLPTAVATNGDWTSTNMGSSS